MTTAADLIAAADGVVFDLFHTLTCVQTSRAPGRNTHEVLGVSYASWREHWGRLNQSWVRGEQTDPVAIIGAVARAIDPTIEPAVIAAAAEARVARFAHCLRSTPPEVVAVVASLKHEHGKRLALCSNADVSEVAAWAESPLAEFFDATIFSCHVGLAKPEPDIFRRAAADLGLAPAACVFVGDGGSDELPAAKALGMPAIMTTQMIAELWPEVVPERMSQADAVVRDLRELLP